MRCKAGGLSGGAGDPGVEKFLSLKAGGPVPLCCEREREEEERAEGPGKGEVGAGDPGL